MMTALTSESSLILRDAIKKHFNSLLMTSF
jgi:hypothetical protein